MASTTQLPRFIVDSAPDARSILSGLSPGVRTANPTAGGSGLLAALPVTTRLPPHPKLDSLTRVTLPGVTLPCGRVAAHGSDWIICRPPEGEVLSRLGPFDEATLIAKVLRPAAAILGRFAHENLTHRAIRPDNLFLGPNGLELGPFWLTPWASTQPCVFESPASASCLPEARGRGTITDDVYALGVTLLALLFGEAPMLGLPDQDVVARKFERGSFQALIDGRRVSPELGDFVLAMVADEPSQRPSPERLERASVVTGPKVSSRRRINAAVPLLLGGKEVWTTPQLAYLASVDPDLVLQALSLGQIDHWLRRSLNEIVLAEKIETIIRPGGQVLPPSDRKASALLLSRVCRLLDPDAPIAWERYRVMPDGVGTLLASLDSRPEAERTNLLAFLSSEALVLYAEAYEDNEVRNAMREFSRLIKGATKTRSSLLQFTYELNPAMSCVSPVVAAHAPTSLSQLILALDALPAPSGPLMLDQHVCAFIGARRLPPRPPPQVASAAAELKLLAGLWSELKPGPLPPLARKLAVGALVEAQAWPGRTQQAARLAYLEATIETGDLMLLLRVLSDHTELRRDKEAQRDAHERIRQLVGARLALLQAEYYRRAKARRFGREGLAVLGLAASAVALVLQLR